MEKTDNITSLLHDFQENALAVFNFLNSEKRYVAGAFIPPRFDEGQRSGPQVLHSTAAIAEPMADVLAGKLPGEGEDLIQQYDKIMKLKKATKRKIPEDEKGDSQKYDC